MKVMLVTGTPGTGKTTVAKKFAKKYKAEYINVNKIIKDNKLRESYDRIRKSYVVDIKKLNKVLMKIIAQAKREKKSIIIDSHLSHYLPAKSVDVCYVIKTSLNKLKNRLQKRRYSKSKIQENMQCEIFDICLMEAKEAGHTVKIITT
jgi:adenylate kinase